MTLVVVARGAALGPLRPLLRAHERLREVLIVAPGPVEALSEAAPLAPPEARAQEASVLLVHLLSRYGLTIPQYLAALGAGGGGVNAALERVRLLCRPFG